MGKLLPFKKVKNILILAALDGSDSGKNAFRQALRFARKERCSITAVTVMPTYEGELELIGIQNMKESFKAPAETILAEARRIAEKEGVQIYTFLAEGDIHESIIDLAVSRDCDLIIMGRRGRTGFERAFMGSVTARVIGYSPIDVLVMPHDSIIKWDNILLAVDGSHYSEIAASRAITFAHTYGKEINILSVVDIPAEAYGEAPDYVEKMVERARDNTELVKISSEVARLQAETFVRIGDAHEKIMDIAGQVKPDVICVGSHGRTGLRRLLMGSVTEKIIGNAKCPVLVVKGQ
ncbi:MAG: universal stress protein [Candidatus Aquicultor sp.]